MTTTDATTTTTTLVVIPCAAAKHTGTHAARDLYASPNFAHTLRAAQLHATNAVDTHGQPTTAKVMILSAQYGLVELNQQLAAYDVKMGQAGCITAAGIAAQLMELAPAAIESLLPAAYRTGLQAAVAALNDDEDNGWIEFMDVYEAAPGIGYQRGVAGVLARLA